MNSVQTSIPPTLVLTFRRMHGATFALLRNLNHFVPMNSRSPRSPAIRFAGSTCNTRSISAWRTVEWLLPTGEQCPHQRQSLSIEDYGDQQEIEFDLAQTPVCPVNHQPKALHRVSNAQDEPRQHVLGPPDVLEKAVQLLHLAAVERLPR
ncbi:hypothetical protein MF271_20080 (plasmid) [Deinococcus sp. KNUC1210]|uniref:hypothetical protein n=1 Tax=Deinococcus sp. KNUC1210 TaxID=2917691 RepID=UPI001EEFFD2C|nr:hypothetical protein [Deinococcus sp. KNUC1210]ULH17709.1 hypothetical protein MF271_20080 [Deinococcus sp. KNUC1210]